MSALNHMGWKIDVMFIEYLAHSWHSTNVKAASLLKRCPTL